VTGHRQIAISSPASILAGTMEGSIQICKKYIAKLLKPLKLYIIAYMEF
jgi:hypothetical protein